MTLSVTAPVVELAVVVFLLVVGGGLALGVRVPGPDEALVVTGRRRRVVTDRRVVAVPGLVGVRRVSLALSVVADEVNGWTTEGLAVSVGVQATWRVGDTDGEILTAAALFPIGQGAATAQVRKAVAARLRDRLAEAPLDALLPGRRALAGDCLVGVGADVATFGLRLEALHIGAITDPSGALEDLARPHRAAIASATRISEAGAARRAAQAEHAAAVTISAARRDAEVARASDDAEVDRAGALARMAGPLEVARLRLLYAAEGPPTGAGQAAEGFLGGAGQAAEGFLGGAGKAAEGLVEGAGSGEGPGC